MKYLDKYEDRPSNALLFTDFFRYVIRKNNNQKRTLPLTEMITLVKHNKPSIYYEMKRHSSTTLSILFDLVMEKEVAQQRLNTYLTS